MLIIKLLVKGENINFMKNVYFYKVDVIDKGTNCDKDVNGKFLFKKLQEICITIIEDKSLNKGNYRVLDLTRNRNELHTIMDIFEYKNSIMFCRLSKQQPNNSMLYRNYENYKQSSILKNEDNNNEGIEFYTYCLLDYNTGIFSIVESRSAPKAKTICSFLDIYSKEYTLGLIEIPNQDIIRTLINGNNAAITKLEFEIPTPSSEAMEKILNWEESEITSFITHETFTVSLTIKSNRRGKLLDNTSDVKKLIEYLKTFKKDKDYNKIKITGRNETIKTREFDLYAKFFSYPIDIVNSYTANGVKKYYSIDELSNIFKTELSKAFEKNKTILKSIINR